MGSGHPPRARAFLYPTLRELFPDRHGNYPLLPPGASHRRGRQVLFDSLYESSPVSKRSRRRKTFPTSDAMDTDANLSDTDYVIGQASEEDESLLEVNFKQAVPNPLTGTLLPSSPEK
ncbi:hypothetical protein TNCT_212191 [Trichonephila clavata]|uniref:Uncharacterized protein n=1 Tax=Trichonephila clavata TaxID=2740835 RepID=A0A8X6FZ35_TRICU|nr:hypothetical protein TNCT_212191 [Trichonephila clavata]